MIKLITHLNKLTIKEKTEFFKQSPVALDVLQRIISDQ